MEPNDKTLIAVICRNQDGGWERVQSIKTNKGDDVFLLPTKQGLVAVLGKVRDEDHLAISRLLKEVEADR
jgi:hypothetical protein